MTEKDVTVGEKTYIVKELKYKDLADMNTQDAGIIQRKIISLSIGMTDEEFDNLSMRDGIAIMKVVNELNGLTDFTIPQPKIDLETN